MLMSPFKNRLRSEEENNVIRVMVGQLLKVNAGKLSLPVLKNLNMSIRSSVMDLSSTWIAIWVRIKLFNKGLESARFQGKVLL